MTSTLTNGVSGLPSFTGDTVLSQLNAAIARRGGPETTYATYAEKMLRTFPKEVRDIVVGLHKCFYVTPTLTLHTEHDPDDCRISVERKFTPQPVDIKPLCLIGCVLVDAGVPVTAFEGATEASCQVNQAQCHTMLADLASAGVLTCDDIAREVLSVAQSSQDTKENWGSAFQRAVTNHAMHIRNATAF